MIATRLTSKFLKNTISKQNFLFKSIFPSFSQNLNFYKHSSFTFTKKESSKEQETKQNEEKPTEEQKESETNTKKDEKTPEEATLISKFKNLEQLYHEQGEKLDTARLKFDQLRKSYIENQEDTERIKNRLNKEIDQSKEFAITKFAKDLLDVHDNFVRALDSVKGKDFKTASEEEKIHLFETLVEGIEMTQKTLTNSLKRHGVVEYIPIKEKFDPNKHEAVFDLEDNDAEHNSIAHVMQSGFMIKERVLRPAKVGVVNNKKNK